MESASKAFSGPLWGIGGGYLTFRKDKAASRFVSNHRTGITALDGSEPIGTTAHGMSNQDAAANLVHQGRQSIRHDLFVERTGIGRHLAHELFPCLWGRRELYAGERVWPYAYTEYLKLKSLIGHSAKRVRYGAFSSFAPLWLVGQIDAKSPPQEDVLEAFPSVGCRLPCFG